jgi:hypothetical protein
MVVIANKLFGNIDKNNGLHIIIFHIHILIQLLLKIKTGFFLYKNDIRLFFIIESIIRDHYV